MSFSPSVEKQQHFLKVLSRMEPEYQVVRAIIEARKSQHLTQKELAERTGINRSDISKLENGNANPSLNTLRRLAEGLNMDMKIEFTPKTL